jgi:pimeloyl-ACP methyl ester carboxylesterase
MTPFYFGTSSRRLFGLYTPGSARASRAVVLCPPWGQEYLRAHRSIRHLGNLLSRAGIHVLRFDYFGTGDSAGEMADADLKGWQNDIGTAIEELKDTAGVTRVALVGLRLGGTLAARVAAGRKAEVEKLVLWDPVVNGDEYLTEMRKLDAEIAETLAMRTTGPGDDSDRLLGFDLPERMRKEIETVDLVSSLKAASTPTLVMVSHALSSHAGLRAGTKHPVVFEEMASEPAWLEVKGVGVGAIPVKVLQRIVEWIG